MTRSRDARLISCFALLALAGVGCNDNESPTMPVSQPAVASLAMGAKPRARVPYISDLQLSSIYVSMSGGYTPYTVTVTNPSQKDFSSIYLRGELKSQNEQPPLTASAFIAYCPNPNGIVPNGDCTMSDGITGGATLAPGPGTFTVYVLQQQSDGTTKVLDSRTVDVVLRQY